MVLGRKWDWAEKGVDVVASEAVVDPTGSSEAGSATESSLKWEEGGCIFIPPH